MLPLRYASRMLAFALAASLAGGAAADAQTVERSMVVSVLDDDGMPVTDLRAMDFVIREDDAAREVLHVEPAGGGRQIAILVDTSEAALRMVSDFRRGLSTFVDEMREGNRISLISFGGPPRILVETTDDAERLRGGIDRVFPQTGQAAYMLDAIHEVSQGFARRRAERPVIVVLTAEGLDYSNRQSRDVIERIGESGAALYTMSVEARRGAFADRSAFGGQPGGIDLGRQRFERDRVLARGTAESGGRHRDLLASSAVERALQELVAELRNQYLVVYARPDLLIPPEEVRVSVDRPGLTARGTLLSSNETRNR